MIFLRSVLALAAVGALAASAFSYWQHERRFESTGDAELYGDRHLLFAQSLPDFERSLEPENPFMAAGGASAEHNDAYSSNVSPWAGPGGGPLRIQVATSGVLCPTLLRDQSGLIVAYCVDTRTRHGTLRLLDSNSLDVLASLDMPDTGRLGGFYMYLDREDRVVLGAGNNHLLRLRHSMQDGLWSFSVVDDWGLVAAVTSHCGSTKCDYLESVTPAWSGRIWFSSKGGVVGTLDPKTGSVRCVILTSGEEVANSISSSPAGVAIASDHALYLFGSREDGTPFVEWREAYDRGTHRKLGQLSLGTGATPVFFGRKNHPYVAITDNADSQEHLLVYRVTAPDGKRLVCRVPLFAPGASGNENGPIGIGDSAVVTNTFGFDYDDHTGQNVKPLPGGIARIDVRPDGSGCDTIWTNSVPSVAVPKFSIRDGHIYTVARTKKGPELGYSFLTIDFRTGDLSRQTPVGNSYSLDTFQLAGLLSTDGVFYQPGITGIIQVRPMRHPKSREGLEQRCMRGPVVPTLFAHARR